MALNKFISFFGIGLLFFSVCSPSQGSDNSSAVLAPKLQHFVDDGVMAGAVVLVADKDRVVDLEAVGYSDLGKRRAMHVDDLFWIASMTKAMTAAAMMMLVDEGRVRIDDPVEKYIPEFKGVKVGHPDGTLTSPSHPIVIREILSHTSGLRFLNSKDHDVIDSAPLEASIKNDLLEPLLFDPGTQFNYSNEGIDTAGRIIEIVSGLSFEQFLKDRLFTPLGMAQTTFHPSPVQLATLAKSYSYKAETNRLEEVPIHYLKSPFDGAERYPAPGGGLFSTANDVCRFCQMLAGGGTFKGKKILSSESVHQMTSKQTGPLVNSNYGFGLWGVDGTAFRHDGAYKTAMDVDHGQIRVFLVQEDGGWSKGNPFNEFEAEVRRSFGPKQ